MADTITIVLTDDEARIVANALTVYGNDSAATARKYERLYGAESTYAASAAQAETIAHAVRARVTKLRSA